MEDKREKTIDEQWERLLNAPAPKNIKDDFDANKDYGEPELDKLYGTTARNISGRFW